MNYKKLKLGKHGIPTWDALAPLVLSYLKNGDEVSSKKITKEVADSLELPDDLRKATYVNNPKSIMIEDRVKWAISELYTANTIERPSRGVYKITKEGQKLLEKNMNEINRETIHSLPAYEKHLKELKQRNSITDTDDEKVPDEATEVNVIDSVTAQTDRYNNEIAAELLKIIQESEPTFFEDLVVKLLVKMGYKGQNGSSTVTQATNDGGIDGIINQDALGTSTVYIQAKRYSDDNVVQRPAIDGFYGALSRVHADRGVFITTSHFSSSAIATAKTFSIVLIDGIQLTNLMLQYHVGVQVKKHLDLFEIDEDFFED